MAGRLGVAAVAVLMVVGVGASACGDDAPVGDASGTDDAAPSPTGPGSGPVIDPGDGGDYAPTVDASDFVDVVDHPYLPLRPGARWVYEVTDDEGETETIVVEVLDERREVMGVSTVVVHDVVSVDGEIIEDTYDWFAQDADGNVWYFGEDTTAYEDGQATTEGSWEAGVDGAWPGVVMPSEPLVPGTAYRQEYLPGEAEDMAEVVRVGEQLELDSGTFDEVLVTIDWTPLEPEVVEEKYYAPGVGFVQEIKTAGGAEVGVLVEYVPGDG